jgi:hypothetical protein
MGAVDDIAAQGQALEGPGDRVADALQERVGAAERAGGGVVAAHRPGAEVVGSRRLPESFETHPAGGRVVEAVGESPASLAVEHQLAALTVGHRLSFAFGEAQAHHRVGRAGEVGFQHAGERAPEVGAVDPRLELLDADGSQLPDAAVGLDPFGDRLQPGLESPSRAPTRDVELRRAPVVEGPGGVDALPAVVAEVPPADGFHVAGMGTPILVGDQRAPRSARVDPFELRSRDRAVIEPVARVARPAGPEPQSQGMSPGTQGPGHVVGDRLHALAEVAHAGRQQGVGDGLTVEVGLVVPGGGHVQQRPGRCRVELEGLAQPRGLPAGGIIDLGHGVLGWRGARRQSDPRGAPVGLGQQADAEGRRFAPGRERTAAVFESNAPPDAVPGAQLRAVVDDPHAAGIFDPTGVPQVRGALGQGV